MTPLRRRMLEDMQIRNLALNTQKSYVQHVSLFARHFLSCVPRRKGRTVLTACYAAGLRISKAIALKPTDVDSQRMTLRVRQGKGRKDRYVMLSEQLLESPREWYRAARPKQWLHDGGSSPTRLSKKLDAAWAEVRQVRELSRQHGDYRCTLKSHVLWWARSRREYSRHLRLW
jgi:integrase